LPPTVDLNLPGEWASEPSATANIDVVILVSAAHLAVAAAVDTRAVQAAEWSGTGGFVFEPPLDRRPPLIWLDWDWPIASMAVAGGNFKMDGNTLLTAPSTMTTPARRRRLFQDRRQKACENSNPQPHTNLH
jgi:hypothetical protein